MAYDNDLSSKFEIMHIISFPDIHKVKIQSWLERSKIWKRFTFS